MCVQNFSTSSFMLFLYGEIASFPSVIYLPQEATLSLPGSSYSSLLPDVPYPCMIYSSLSMYALVLVLCSWETGRLFRPEHAVCSPQVYIRQIATCNSLGTVQSTCVEIGSAMWLTLVEHPSTVQINSNNG